MAMTPENYVNLKRKSSELCNRCKKIIDLLNNDDSNAEEQASEAYDEIAGLEKELEIAIRNIKTPSISKEYERCLENIKAYKVDIYFIAHIM